MPETQPRSGKLVFVEATQRVVATRLGAPFGRVAFLKSPNSAESELGPIFGSGALFAWFPKSGLHLFLIFNF